jgi:hypothetical protein
MKKSALAIAFSLAMVGSAQAGRIELVRADVGYFESGDLFDWKDHGRPTGRPVPEPTTLALVGLGLFGLTTLRKRKGS